MLRRHHHAVPAGPRRARPAAPAAASPARCGWPAGCVLPVRKLGARALRRRGRPGCCWPAAPCTPTCPRRRPAPACTAGCWPCSASRSAGRCRSAARSGSPTRWSPGCSSAAARILYGARVDRVLTARGRAMGVRTRGRHAWRARRAVLADVPAPALYLDLVGAALLPPRLVEDLAHFRWDGSTLKVDWALSAPVPWTNPQAGRRRHRAPGRGPRRADPTTRPSWPAGELPARPVPAGRADDDGRPDALAGRAPSRSGRTPICRSGGTGGPRTIAAHVRADGGRAGGGTPRVSGS